MKKTKLILLSLIAFISFSNPVMAATSTSSATQTDLQQKAQKLLDLVASDAAKLNLTEKRGIIGTVTNVSSTQITVDDANGNRRLIDVDELTKFSNPAVKGTFGISDIEKGQKLGILGLYNKSSRRILARFIDVISTTHFMHGTVIKIDSKNFNFDVITDENKQINIDVATVTKTFSHSTEDGLTKAGFSKINENQNIVVTGYFDKKDASKIIADVIILFPELPANPEISIPGTSASGNALPSPSGSIQSTGSGKVLTPNTQ